MERVKTLVNSYVEQPECLVLVTIPMSGMCTGLMILIVDELANQRAMEIDRRHDSSKQRTIGNECSLAC